MRRRIRLLLCLPMTFLLSAVHSEKNYNQDSTRPEPVINYIDPTIGNVGHLLEPTRPTVHLPNQIVRVYPIRKDYLDDRISSFPLTAVSHRLGEVFAVRPVSGNISPVVADTICIQGDGKQAALFAKDIFDILKQHNIDIKAV